MKNSESEPIRFTKLKFPFMQRQQSTGSIKLSPTKNSPRSFFGIRKFGSKPPNPIIPTRKIVSFSPTVTKTKVDQDYTDAAYREAFSKLKNVLNPKLATRPDATEILSPKSTNAIQSPTFESNNIGLLQKIPPCYQPSLINNSAVSPTVASLQAIQKSCQNPQTNTDLFGFIDKQGEYISQLEKETSHCRKELGSVLEKVKEVITENEALHEKQKRDMLTTMIKHLEDGGKGFTSSSSLIGGKCEQVIRDAKVAELEAQLVQVKRNLRLAQEENLEMKKGKPGSKFELCEMHISEIEKLTKEKKELTDTITKFKEMINELKDKESEASRKVKSSLEIVDQIKDEKAQSDLESRRLREELDRHQQRVREMIQENSRKIHEEKLLVEKKYRQEIDNLSHEMSQEFDTLTKARLDLERQKRVENDLKRDLQLKVGIIDDLRIEMQIKINHLQSELAHVLSQKSTAEQELIASKLQAEKIERDGKQECAKLQMELNLVRKRLEEADVDLGKSQDVIIRLNESISQLQRDASLARIRLEGHLNPEDGEVNAIIQAMEDKQSRDMTELEQLIQVQNNLLDKLRNECSQLAHKLEDTTQITKKEKTMLEGERDRLAGIQKVTSERCADLEHKLNFYSSSYDTMTTRMQKLEEDDKNRSEKIFSLLSNQSTILKENQSLQNEVSYLRRKLKENSQ